MTLGNDARTAALGELAASLLDALDDPALDRLAQLLLPRLGGLVGVPGPESPWLDVPGAAGHLACSKYRIYKLVQERQIPFHKDGGRLLFRPEELDAWIRAGGGKLARRGPGGADG
jgi:excisionase family DNA binding protein